MLRFLRCLAVALAKHAPRGLAGLLPFGEAAYDVAREAFASYRSAGEGQLRADLEAAACATPEQARRAAEEVAASHPAELRPALVSFLEQVPARARRTLRGPASRLRGPEDLLPFLPDGPPRFRPGDRPLQADYELVELLGQGGFGEVWKARHVARPGQRPVALKFCLDPEAARALRHEASLHAELDRLRRAGGGEGVVPLLETFLSADPPCLMYEYVEGGELGQYARAAHERGLMTPELATRLVRRLALAVAGPHRLSPPLVHHDLKPSNVLVRPSGGEVPELWVADFGIGGLAVGPAAGHGAKPTALRGAHTPLYASPQQLQGGPPDPRDDVYAIGVIWYQLLTGELSLRAVPPDWREAAEERGLDAARLRLLGACLAHRPERRPADAAELAAALGPATPSGAAAEVDVTVPGEWLLKAGGGWRPVFDTPGRVAVRPGEEYGLKARRDASAEALAGLARLEHVGALRRVDLRECPAVGDSALAHLGRLASLESLDLGVSGTVTEGGLAYLSQLTGLRELDLTYLEVRDEGLALLRGLSRLQVLALGHCHISDRGAPHLRGLAELRHLDLSSSRMLTDDGLSSLRGLARLEHLSLSRCTLLTGAGLCYLRRLPLKALHLEGCQALTDEGLEHLAGLASLEELNLKSCPLLTDTGLRHLSRLKGLRRLNLANCRQLTNEGLQALCGLVGLRELGLSCCDELTPEGKASLVDGLPDCTLV